MKKILLISAAFLAALERLEALQSAPYLYEPPTREACKRQREDAAKSPSFSVVVPAYATRTAHLQAMLDSIKAQTNPNWELLLADATAGNQVQNAAQSWAREAGVPFLLARREGTFQPGCIRYLKLDMNCFFSSPGGSERIWIDYAANLDWIFQTLSRDFPGLLLENCASGAARASLQMTRAFGRMNRSDNQDTLDILKLHEGFTYMNLPRMAGGACHISDSNYYVNHRTVPLKYQACCGMLGSLACGKNLMRCSDEELAEIRQYVDLYKKLRRVIHLGDLYRLASAFDHPYAIYEYVAQDRSEAVVFVLGTSFQFATKMPPFLLPGLDSDAVYDITCYGADRESFVTPVTPERHTLTGRGAAQVGIQVSLIGDFDCRILHLVRRK